MTYQKVTGALMANSHPGSYCGQDAYNDMLIVGEQNVVRREWATPSGNQRQSRSIELYAQPANSFSGGGYDRL